MAINSLGLSLTEKLKEGVSWMAKPYRIALASLLLMTAAPTAQGQNVAINGTGTAANVGATLHISRTDSAGAYIPSGTPLLTESNLAGTINGAVLSNRSNFPSGSVRLLLENRSVPALDGRNAAYIEAIRTLGGNASQSLGFGTATDGATPATEKMRLTPDGRLGLGTPTPTSKLDVQISAADALTNLLNIRKGTNPYLHVSNGGGVGIGTNIINPLSAGLTVSSVFGGNVNIRQEHHAVDNYADIIYSPSYHRYLSIKTLGPQPASTFLYVNADDDLSSYGKDAHLNNTIVSPDRAGHYFSSVSAFHHGMVIRNTNSSNNPGIPTAALKIFANPGDPTAIDVDGNIIIDATAPNVGNIIINTTNPIEGRIIINGIVQGKTRGDGPVLPPVAGSVRGDEFLLTPGLQWYKFNGVAWAPF